MNQFQLTVIRPVSADIRLLQRAARMPVPEQATEEANLFTLEIDQDLALVKQNADAIATRAMNGSAYTALHVVQL